MGLESFVYGQVISDCLQGVEIVREGIDNGDGAVFRETGDVGVGAHAGEPGGYHGRNDDGGVVQGLVDAELDVFFAEEHGVAA